MVIAHLDPAMQSYLAKPTSRLMAFVDGENLVCRYQDAIEKEGVVPRDNITHERDVLVWNPSFTHLASFHEILRVTYYTSMTGSYEQIAALRRKINGLQFNKHRSSFLPNNLTPFVIKRHSDTRHSKGVDIQLCVDVLGQVYRKNVDAILLLTGDGDYIPLIEEVLRHGVQVFLSSFSRGLHPGLRDRVDAFIELDGMAWQTKP